MPILVTWSRSTAMLSALRTSTSLKGALVVLSCQLIIAPVAGNQYWRCSLSLEMKVFSMLGMYCGAQSTSPFAAARLAPSFPAKASILMPAIFCFSGCQ